MKKIIKSIWTFLSGLFNRLNPALKKAINIGVAVTDAIKNFDEKNSYVGDIITALIPGDVDDRIKVLLRANLPKIVIELKLVQATQGLTDPNEIMLAATKVIQQLSGDYRSAFLNSLAIITAQVAADGKLDWNDAAYLLKWYYDNKK